MDSKVNYSIVGIFVIALSVVMIYMIIWLTSGITSKHYKTYLVFITESVSGMSVQSPVKYNGVQVGYVDDIALNESDPSQVRLLLKIESSVRIRKDTTATVETQGVTGIAYIGLRGGTPTSPLLAVKDGQPYPVITARPSLFLRVDIALSSLTNNLDSVMTSLKAILDKDNREAISTTLQNLRSVSEALAKNSQRLDVTIQNLSVTLKNTAQASERLPTLITKAESSLGHITVAGAEVSKTMAKGRTMLDSLTPPLYQAVQNIGQLSMQLNNLSKELQQQPSVLLRGKAASAPGPGE